MQDIKIKLLEISEGEVVFKEFSKKNSFYIISATFLFEVILKLKKNNLIKLLYSWEVIH